MINTKKINKLSKMVAKPFMLLMVVLGLSACSHINLSTALALRNTDPATIDISQMRLALALPNEIPFNQASIHLSVTKKDGVTKKIDVPLFSYLQGPELAAINTPNDRSYVVVLAVPPKWYDEIEYYQTIYQQELQAPTGASMSFGFDLRLDPEALTEQCLVTEQGIPITSWFRFEVAEGYHLLVRNSPLEKLFEFKAQNICK